MLPDLIVSKLPREFAPALVRVLIPSAAWRARLASVPESAQTLVSVAARVRE